MRTILVTALCAFACAPAFAQDAGQRADTIAAVQPVNELRQTDAGVGAGAAAAGSIVVPKLTPVMIRVLAPLGSKLSKTGDTFPIVLAQPIVIGGREAVPAGATGMDEVIFAKKSGGLGAAGELVATARYLDVDGRRLTLRSMHFAEAGKDNYGLVHALETGGAATVLPVVMVGFFIAGKQVTVPEGAWAEARTADDFEVVPADSPTVVQPSSAAQADTPAPPDTAP